MTGSVVFQPLGKRVPADVGRDLLDIAQRAGVGINSVCGGIGICGNCRVRVGGRGISELNTAELETLHPHDTAGGLRLACQAVVLDDAEDIVVDVPPGTMLVGQRSQVEGEQRALALVPTVRVHDLAALPPSVTDLRGDWERLTGASLADWTVSAPVLATLPACLRANHWRVSMVTQGSQVLAFLQPDSRPLGVAVDVGTTGLAAYLLDLLSGETLATVGATNPQIAYGEDVMSRLTAVARDETRAGRLQQVLVDELNRLIGLLCAEAGVERSAVVEVAAVGNTAMHHLLFGLPVDQLGRAPYVPAFASELSTPARDLGLAIAPGAPIFTPPCIAGFVGADHVAMLLASGALTNDGVTLYLDIGTNTEISLTARGEHWCCSAASGPAFEGAHIAHGIRAADGAIERVSWNGDGLHWRTINDRPPIGICGSGIVDCIAVLTERGILSAAGALRRADPLVRGAGKDSWIEVAGADESANGQAVILSRADVSEIQMAKAAIRAGIKLLVETAGLRESEIDTIILAGAFGTYIDPQSACTIGLIPTLPLQQIHQVGNAAGVGAQQLLLNVNDRAAARRIVRHVHYVELTTHAQFRDRFSQALRLLADPWDEDI